MKQQIASVRMVILTILMSAAWVRAEAPTSAPAGTEETRKAFLAIIDRPRADLAAQVDPQSSDGGIVRSHFTYASEADVRVPGLLLAREDILKDGKRHPAVIVLHGTGGNKESELGVLHRLAERNLVAVAIDGRYHGERGKQADYNAAIARAFEDGKSHPLYLDTVWDVTRLIDYLQSRPDVDPQRIGLMGISPEKFKLIVEPNTGHAVTPDAHAAAVEWFVKWLGDGEGKE